MRRKSTAILVGLTKLVKFIYPDEVNHFDLLSAVHEFRASRNRNLEFVDEAMNFLSWVKVVNINPPHMLQELKPLVLVDDDAEDQELMLEALRALGFKHEVRTFNTAEAALNFLYESGEQPFMIVSDINMPKMDGLTFKKTIDSCKVLGKKCIPFVFISTSTNFVKETCNLNIQGYFEKGNTWEDLQETMKIILQYWERTKHLSPN